MIINSYIQAIARKYSITVDTAFEILSAALILDKPFNEIHQNIWIGSGFDCGFDAIYIDEKSNIIYVFQSKNSPSLVENELMKLETDFNDFFVCDNRSNRRINTKLQAKLDEFREITTRGIAVTPKLYFVYNGKNIDPNNANNSVLATQFNLRSVTPEFNIIDSNALISKIASYQHERRNRVEFTFKPEDTNIPTYSNQALFSFVIGQVTGVSFRIPTLQLCELIEKEIEVNGFMDMLFSENIRGYLGHNKTNKNILKTLNDRHKSIFFPFMNNGLTVICENISVPSVPQLNQYNISVVNPTIVNGLQTTRIIYEIYQKDRELLRDVYLTLKLYESRDSELTDLITEATNTQAQINFRDQISNKKFNEHAEVYFTGKGVKYIFKRGQIVRGDNLASGLIDSVTNETVLKFWYATYNKNPRLAKNSKNSILENVFLATKGEDPVLSNLFNGDSESPLYEQLFLAYRIQKLVAAKRLELCDQSGQDYLVHADELISYGIFKELENNNLIVDLQDEDLEEKYDIAKNKVQNIVEEEKTRRGGAYSPTKYFKGDAIVQDYDQRTS